MSENAFLPFPRGQAYSDAGVVTMTDTLANDLLGRIFRTKDTVHGTGEEILLRVVKNDTGAAIVVANEDRALQRFSTIDLHDFGRKIAGEANAAGIVCKPIDDAYPDNFSIPDDDLFYVVERGPCYCTSDGTATSLNAGDGVSSGADGQLNGVPAAAGHYVVGMISEDADAVDTQVVVVIQEGLKQGS